MVFEGLTGTPQGVRPPKNMVFGVIFGVIFGPLFWGVDGNHRIQALNDWGNRSVGIQKVVKKGQKRAKNGGFRGRTPWGVPVNPQIPGFREKRVFWVFSGKKGREFDPQS